MFVWTVDVEHKLGNVGTCSASITLESSQEDRARLVSSSHFLSYIPQRVEVGALVTETYGNLKNQVRNMTEAILTERFNAFLPGLYNALSARIINRGCGCNCLLFLNWFLSSSRTLLFIYGTFWSEWPSEMKDSTYLNDRQRITWSRASIKGWFAKYTISSYYTLKKTKRTIMAMFSSLLEIYCLVLGCQWCSIDWRQSDRNTALETNYLANFMPSAYISSDLCDCMQRTISFRVNLYLM